MMRSLAAKLTLAFLLVGVVGAVLVAVLIGWRTRSEFDQFVASRDERILEEFLEGYYVEHHGWEGVERQARHFSNFSRDMVVTDSNGRVIISRAANRIDTVLNPEAFPRRIELIVEGEPIGWLISINHGEDSQGGGDGRSNNRPPFVPPDTVGAEFINNVFWAATVSTAIAIILALVMGTVLARTLTRPIRALTTASERMAAGALGHQVAVQSQDEIGDLATAFNQMSHDLDKNQQQRRQMTADIAHDLRTPLSILRGYMEGLKDGRLEGSPQLYDIMFGEVSHLQRLVEELRTLSLADAGELRLNLRPIDPKALLERTGLAYVLPAEEKGLTLQVAAQDSLPSVQVDSDRMAQVLGNLVANAITHTDSGDIILSARQNQDAILLEVTDSGSGIAPEDLPHIFNRFYRADQSRHRTNGASSGLGLAIAKAIVEAHGGEITAVSPPNSGTTMRISLPTNESSLR